MSIPREHPVQQRVQPTRVTYHPGRGSQTPGTRSSADHLEILNWSKTKVLKENLRLSLSGRLNVLPLKGICVKEAVNGRGDGPRGTRATA